MPKMVHFGEFLKTCSLRSNSVTRQVNFNMTKISGKCQNSNATFSVIFKQYVDVVIVTSIRIRNIAISRKNYVYLQTMNTLPNFHPFVNTDIIVSSSITTFRPFRPTSNSWSANNSCLLYAEISLIP